MDMIAANTHSIKHLLIYYHTCNMSKVTGLLGCIPEISNLTLWINVSDMGKSHIVTQCIWHGKITVNQRNPIFFMPYHIYLHEKESQQREPMITILHTFFPHQLQLLMQLPPPCLVCFSQDLAITIKVPELLQWESVVKNDMPHGRCCLYTNVPNWLLQPAIVF